ncbi:MAG: hypothetical protein GY856_05115 [bacterium]|nr:hypothetical protein [bacterium]
MLTPKGEIRFKRYAASLLILLLWSSLPLVSCAQDDPEPAAETPAAATPAETPTPPAAAAAAPFSVVLQTIDGVAAEAGETMEVGMQAVIEGSVSAEVVTCVLVNPTVMKTWWVQPPAKLMPQDDQSWAWQSSALFGTETIGQGDLFRVVALAEAETKVCQPRNSIKELPADGVRSEIYTVKRTKD